MNSSQVFGGKSLPFFEAEQCYSSALSTSLFLYKKTLSYGLLVILHFLQKPNFWQL